MAKAAKQGALKAKADEGRELTEKAKSLADVAGSNMVAVGVICSRFANEQDLWDSLGYKSYDDWESRTFGKKKKNAQRVRKIVETLLGELTEEQLLQIGNVRAWEFSRLPESERAKPEWRKAVMEDDTATFKQKVKAFLENRPDHKGDFCTISFPAPKTFRDETFARVIAQGKAVEETDEVFLVVEAAFAAYEQDVQEMPEAKLAMETFEKEREAKEKEEEKPEGPPKKRGRKPKGKP